MRYEDIKTYAERCESHPDHQIGIVTYQMVEDRLLEEIEELRAYIETKHKPLTDDEIDKVTDAHWRGHKPIYAAHRAYAKAIEQAHGIGKKD
jgi:aminoglycoside phosphotransferase family enzyme